LTSTLNRRKLLKIFGAALLVRNGTAAAQNPSGRPIRVVVPYPPGGVVDPVARLMGPLLSASLGQPVLIENRPGAAGAIGIAAVAHALPDGNTLLFHSSTITTSATVQHENTKVSVESLLTPIALVAKAPFLVVVNPDLPVSSMSELIAYAKANPGKLNYGSSGRGSSNHLAAELLKRMAGIDIVHVPFQGGGPAINALVGGQIQVGFDTMAGSGAMVKAGRLRAIAVSSAQRSKALPDVPAIQESGVPGYDVNFWLGYFAPSGTPTDVVERLATTIRQVSGTPNVLSKLALLGLDRSDAGPKEFAALFHSEIERWDELLHSLDASQ
jgi:tripartite-type tricarboxylate transporter receptor subunit TctC